MSDRYINISHWAKGFFVSSDTLRRTNATDAEHKPLDPESCNFAQFPLMIIDEVFEKLAVGRENSAPNITILANLNISFILGS